MPLEWRLYDCGILGETLLEFHPKKTRRIIHRYLERGAHPYFLEQGLRLAVLSPLAQQSYGSELERMARAILYEPKQRAYPVPEVWDTGLLRASSRLFLRNGSPRRDLEEGIFHGAILETFYDLFEDILQNGNMTVMGEWGSKRETVLARFLDHPDCNLGILDNVVHRVLSFDEFVIDRGFGATLEAAEPILPHSVDAYLRLRMEQKGVDQFFCELAGVWNDPGAHRFLGYFVQMMKIIEERANPAEMAITQVVESLTRMSKGNDMLEKHVAQQIIEGVTGGHYSRMVGSDLLESINMALMRGAFINSLKDELVNLSTIHATVLLFQATPTPHRGAFLLNFVHTMERGEQPQIDERTESLVEQMFGPEVWRALCDLQDPACWKHAGSIISPNIHIREGVNELHPAYRRLSKAVRRWNLARHQALLASSLDNLVHQSNLSMQDLERLRDDLLNLLIGDVILTVTHLRNSWMPYRRRREDVLGVELPTIEVARRENEMDQSAACRFRITIPDVSNVHIRGELDTAGEMTLENILVLTPLSRLALQAVVLHALVVALIPRYIDAVPFRGTAGARVPRPENFWTRQPVIHTRGEIGQHVSRPTRGGGTKINPLMVLFLFQWLLDEDTEPSRVHRKASEVIDGHREVYFVTASDAKILLQERRARLSDFYLHTVRAYSRPLPITGETDEGLVLTQQMSEKARRYYQHYMSDIGRALDFSPVQKTYRLRDDRRVVVDVPRTFVIGAFNTLTECHGMIPDPGVQQRAREHFLL